MAGIDDPGESNDLGGSMGTAGQVDGLAGALLRCVEEPTRIAAVQEALDRYCHRLRNRLNSMKLSLYLARKLTGGATDPAWDRADSAYRSMERLIEQLQQFHLPLQVQPTEGDLGRWLEHRLGDWNRVLAERSIRLEAGRPSDSPPTWFDWSRLGQGLDGLIHHWAESGPTDSSLRLSWETHRDRCRIRFETEGWMVCPSSESFALPLLARVLKAHRGSMAMFEDDSVIELSWPTGRLSPCFEETS